MTTDKQIEANRENALVSTGPITEEGKAIVAKNAVKHSVFSQDLIISSGDGEEDPEEYQELLRNLIVSLIPQNQMEHLLVEKISVDFWRLKRLLRFETGSIRQYLDMTITDYYSEEDYLGKKKHRTSEELDEDIKEKQSYINWNKTYLKCLDRGIVSFDQPAWKGEGLESDIADDLWAVFHEEGSNLLDEQQYYNFKEGELNLSFDEMTSILKNKGFTSENISTALIRWYNNQNQDYSKQIDVLERKKIKNKYTDEVNIKLHSLPSNEDVEKVMRYEKSIQKSILQNLALLKKLQSMP